MNESNSCQLNIQGLSVTRENKKILENITFQAKGGEITALIGRNGAGKTTLLKAILDQLPHEGTISCTDEKGTPIKKPIIGYVPQNLSIDPYAPITVSDLLCANITRAPVWLLHKKSARQKAISLLQKTGGELLIDKPLRALSGGEMQRVLLAFALWPVPNLLLLDEPVSAVDTVGIDAFYATVIDLESEFHMPILLVSHNLAHIKKYTNSAILLDKTVLQAGSTEQVLNSHAFQEAFGLL